jgi:hypothetical protein
MVQDAFNRWAWKITSEGELKDEPSLTPSQHQLWYEYIAGVVMLCKAVITATKRHS